MTLGEVPDGVPRGARLDPQILGFIAAGNRAPVVVGEDHHRQPDEVRTKGAFATDVKVVAVDQRIECHRYTLILVIDASTTPQTEMVWPSLGT